MDIRDEIDAMLDSLKNGGKSTSSVKSPPKINKENPPPAVKPAAPRRTVYDEMSVDDLLNALTVEKKPEPTPTKRPIPEPIKPSVPKQNSAASAVEPIIEDYIQPKKAVTVSVTEAPKRSAVVSEKSSFDSEKLLEIMKRKSNPEPEKAAEIPEEAPDAEELEFVEPEPIEELVEDFVEDELPDEPDNDDEIEEDPEEIAPVKEKKGLFGGIKALFSKKNDTSDEADDAENIEDNDIDEEVPEEISADIIEEEPIEDTIEEAEYEEFHEESTANIETGDEQIEDDIPQSVTEASEPKETPSATELIDAAIAAIEDIRNEECFAEDNETSDELKTEGSDADEAAEPDSEEEIANASEALIAEIREDAENTIAELSSEIAVENVDDSENEIVETVAEEDKSSDEKDIDIDVELEQGKPKSKLVTALEKILEEDPNTISDERSEKTEDDEIDVSLEKKSSGKLKQRIYGVLGVIFTVLAVFGLISVISRGASHLRSFTSGEDKKIEFISVIYPAVIMDIESFGAPSELSSEQIISASLWSLVMSADDMEKYEQTFDVISVPAIDVEVYAAQLFGDGLPALTHSTVGSGELKFYYNEETKSYNVPVNPIAFTYEPEVKSVSKKGSEYTVTVDYIKELPAWMEESQNFNKEVSKTVEFRLAESGDSYVILSMTVLKVNNIA